MSIDKIEDSLTPDEIKISDLKNHIFGNCNEKNDILDNINDKTSKKYYEVLYAKEFYDKIKKIFFNREYVTEAKDRMLNIKSWLKDQIFRYKLVLNACNNEIETEDYIEAFEIESICQKLLENFFTDKIEKKKNNTITKKDKITSLLKNIDEYDKEEENRIIEENNIKQEEEKIFSKPIKDRIDYLYNKVLKKAIEKDGEENGIIHSYITELFNPETTKLNYQNLYLNLKILDLFQKFNILNWNFNTSYNNVSTDEYDLSMKHWENIMNETIDDDEKFIKIVEKNFTYFFYNTILKQIAKKADRVSITEKSLKMRNLLVDTDLGETEINIEEYIIEKIKEKTEDNSLILITKDLIDYIDIDKKSLDVLSDKHIQYLGKWKNRDVFSYEQDNFSVTHSIKNYAMVINSGNNFNFNPDKPILNYHDISNPFLEKPILKLFSLVSIDIYMSNSTLINIEPN